MSAAEIGICARVDNVTAQDVKNALWKDRSLVKTWCMRGTLHLLASRDLPLYIAALKTRSVYWTGSWLKGHNVSLDEIDRITSETRNALDGRCLTRGELVDEVLKRTKLRSSIREVMSSGWGSVFHPAACRNNLIFGPAQGKNVTFVRPDQWLGKWDEPSSEEALTILVRRFLTAFGPCSHDEFAHWWGTPESNVRRIFQPMIGELEQIEFEGRRTWLGKEDAEQIATIKPVKSVRLLPSFDPYVMFYSPRESLVSPELRSKIFRQLAGWVSPVLLIDGIAAGTWTLRKRAKGIQVTVDSFRSLNRAERMQVENEVNRLGEFLGTHAEIRFSHMKE